MADNKLHIIPKITFRETYNKAMGSLVLEQAETFFVTIAEYEKDEKEIKKLEEKKRAVREFAVKKWEQHAEEGWDKKKLEENYNANMQEWEKANKAIQAFEEKYNDVNWCWQLVGSKLDYNNLSHNKSFTKGIYQIKNTGKQSIQFPELLEGGGMAWLEAFHEKEGAVGNTPYGIYVQAYGTPKIIRTEWTDFNYEPIKGSVGFMSKVILHIYTRAMYGQEVDIQLIDRDLFDPNDVLNAFESETFRGEVNIFKIKKNEIGKKGVSDLLTKSNETNTDTIVEKEQYVQKIELEVLIDADWEKLAGSNLQIFCTIKSKQTGTFFEGFERNYLNVDANSLILTAEKEVSNKPVVVGQVETNVVNFSHCRYDKIELKKQGKTESVVLFDSVKDTQRELKTIPVEIIAGKKETYLLDFDFETTECENKPVKHINKELTVLSIPKDYELKIDSSSKAEHKIKKEEKELIKSESNRNSSIMGAKTTQKEIIATEKGIVTIRQKQIEFDAFYNYDIPQDSNAITTFFKAMNYFWLPNLSSNKINKISATTTTCALQQNVNIAIYPDIKWTLKFGFNVKKDDIEKLNRNGGTFAPLKIYEDNAKEKNEADFKTSKDNSDKVNEKNLRRKEILDNAGKHFSEKYDLKQKKEEVAIIDKGTSFKQLLEILKRLTVSLSEEHYGGDIKNELTDEFVKQLYEQIKTVIDLAKIGIELLEGKYDKNKYKQEDDKSIDGLMAKLNRKPIEYEMLYPKLSFAGSWFYEQIDVKQYPELRGRQGLGINLMLKATPLIGVTIKWDILELLCRRYPIAYAVLKAVDALLYILADDSSAIKCDFFVTGQIDTTIDLQLNCLAGFKDFKEKGKSAIKSKIELKLNINNSYKIMKYEIIKKLGFGTAAEIGLGITDLYGVDISGIYIQKILEFEGIKISFSVTGE